MAITRRIILSLFITLNLSGYSGVLISVNGRAVDDDKIIFAKQNDTLCLANTDSVKKLCWYEIIPEQMNYDISNKEKPYSDKIKYTLKKIDCGQKLTIINESAGTRYFGLFEENDSIVIKGEIFDKRPLALCYENIYQIAVRRDNSFLGYCTELINTPFILPPLYISNYGHQTDLRIGSDCAELAIYGRRRQGYNVPYVGPMGIGEFLDAIKKDSVFEGCILHFGFQVSVLYEDNGIKGKLEENDVLIQSYETKACTVEYRKCGYYGMPYKAFRWKKA